MNDTNKDQGKKPESSESSEQEKKPRVDPWIDLKKDLDGDKKDPWRDLKFGRNDKEEQ